MIGLPHQTRQPIRPVRNRIPLQRPRNRLSLLPQLSQVHILGLQLDLPDDSGALEFVEGDDVDLVLAAAALLVLADGGKLLGFGKLLTDKLFEEGKQLVNTH